MEEPELQVFADLRSPPDTCQCGRTTEPGTRCPWCSNWGPGEAEEDDGPMVNGPASLGVKGRAF